MWDYSEKVREEFLHPKNVGEIKDADAVGEVGSIICGDALKLFLKIDKDSDRIVDAKFQTFGCASAIASSSALTELVKGKTLDEAAKITNQDIAAFLGGLPHQKMHCSVMGKEALDAAIASYRGLREPLDVTEKLVCKCFDVSEEKIRRAVVDNRLTSVEEVTNFTKAGGGCGECRGQIEHILKDVWHTGAPPKAHQAGRRTNLQKIALIQDVINREIRPGLQADRGDIEIVDIDGNVVSIALRGTCTGCRMADVTRLNIEKKLREVLNEEIVVTVGE